MKAAREILADELDKLLCHGSANMIRRRSNMAIHELDAALAAMARTRADAIEECAVEVESLVGAPESMLEAAALIRALATPPEEPVRDIADPCLEISTPRSLG